MKYFYRIGEKTFGPIDAKLLWERLQSNKLPIERTEIRREDKKAWVPAKSIRLKKAVSDFPSSDEITVEPTPLSIDSSSEIDADTSHETPHETEEQDQKSYRPRPFDALSDPVPLADEVPPMPRSRIGNSEVGSGPTPEIPLRFQAMRAIAMIYRVIAGILLLSAALGLVFALFGLSILAFEEAAIHDNTALNRSLTYGGLLVFGINTILGVFVLAIAEGIQLGIQLEHNQRTMIALVTGRQTR
jgi:hypothetical protein